MTTDLKEFHDAFFEESFEALDDMEAGLLNINIEAFDLDEINTIFRAAHSIKGCSATFGFTDIATFVHRMETALDNMRSQLLEMTPDLIDLLLKSLDTLRTMFIQTKAEQPIDKNNVQKITEDLNVFLTLNTKKENSTLETKVNLPISVTKQNEGEAQWQIKFIPSLNILKTGNDPLRLFKVLAEMAEIKTEVDVTSLIGFRVIEPEECYLSWQLLLKGNINEQEILDIFEWVQDDCQIEVLELRSESQTTSVTQEIQHTTNRMPESAGNRNAPSVDTNGISQTTGGDSLTIRVDIEKVDTIINMVGELVITQSMLDQLGQDFDNGIVDTSRMEKLREGLSLLERNTRELQESVMRIRMLPISYVFNRVPRIVHDLTKKLNKHVNIKMSGESTELDKTVLEKIGDPIVHLIRNAIDHGIEAPAQRRAAGKSDTGTIFLNAFHRGGNIIIEIKDDGSGLNRAKIKDKAVKNGLISAEDPVDDQQIIDLIFHAGFSTAEVVSDVSGRGVGMDVVRKNIKSLGGTIDVKSQEGTGTSFVIKLPLTLAILDGQLVRVGVETYIIPLVSIIESIQVEKSKTNIMAGQAELYRLRDEHIVILRMHELFRSHSNTQSVAKEKDVEQRELMVVVESEGKKVGLIVDDLLTQQQVVIKSLDANYKRIEGISGATILGDGTVALIADISGIVDMSTKSQYFANQINSRQGSGFRAA